MKVAQSLLIVKVLGLFLIPEVNTSIECTTTIDLVFVMDLSGSVQTHGYETMKAFIKEMISRYQIGSANTRVGLVVFNIEAYVEFYLDTYYQKEELISAMDNIRSFGRETYTDRGLYSARMNVLQESAGDRQDVPNVVLVLTDGKSKDPTKTAYQANLLHSSGAEVIALGIGSNADLDELNAIASDPDEENMYRVSDFDSMSSIIDELVMKTCGGPMCSELPHPSNGRRLGEDRRVGASVYFECDSGYTLQGSDKRTCGPNDVWDGVIASCPPSACPELPHPENGRRVGNSLQVSSTVSFECNLGYTLYGSEQRTCQPDEQWDGQTAYCQVSECPELPNPENGYRVGSARQVGDTVSFSCNLGYTLQGSQQRTCQINKVWDGETSYCYVSLCPQLPYPENGRRIGDNYQVNDTVSFECNVGYTLHGSQQRTCQPNKVWDGETSHCYESLCDQLPAPEHGHLEGDLHRHIGDKVSLECIEGYAVEGSWERVCQDNREWSGQPGSCVRIPPEESMPTIEPDLPPGIEDVRALDYMPVVYNFYDVLAEAGCMGWVKDNQAVGVWAMRRSCNGVKTCNEVCNHNRLECVHSYQIYLDPNLINANIDEDEGANLLQTVSYEPHEGCSWPAGHCGPNYCCCFGKWNTVFEN